ncbi:B12-binding domain-containing radical SAM protein [Streptomyces sp. NBC_00525]|uniref:B12-binding domain-containing radical SAM protein n=1 Tax=Streptomyces sp. NBC_00525 TaxID=2903660 RepID=UPI002E81E884|nr:radical SAM protein [Streptomyces sp. NBC_00525]WUC96656.1 radical SAM protein [Streptomyces sp. NBC_00525]
MSVFVPLGMPRFEGGPDRGPRPGRGTGDTAYLLINPPVTDPTTAYHSIPYLVGAARAAGHTEYACVDANLDAFTYLADPARFGAALDAARALRAEIGARAAAPRRHDEIRYRQTLAAEGLTATSARDAIAVFQDAEHFYHPPTYAQAVAVMSRWWQLLALDMPPGTADGFSMRVKAAVNLCSTKDLSDPAVPAAVARPFEGYFTDEFVPKLRERPWAVVGLSVNYTSQLPVALRMARLVRTVLPDTVIVFGGTEVGDVVKYAPEPAAAWRVFQDADLIVPGEGETALIGILDAVGNGATRHGDAFEGIGGVMTRNRPDPDIAYGSVATLASPAYDVWQWDRYWAPEPVLLYSPTRGCYWNKCTFCDYGLNTDRPTSPSRERPVAAVLQDLREASSYARTVYFAVDAMSPRYLRTLAAALAESSLDLRWSAELRLERTFPKRSAGEVLAASGCVAVSFGYESGAQRVLDLIDKGVKIEVVPDVLAELARNGIAAQMMGFTGFPTETAEEALETYEFLQRHEKLWTTSGIGVFALTPGSMVAKNPDRFGIDVLPTSASDDIRRYLPWRDRRTGEAHWPVAADPRIPREYYAGNRRTDFDRPFLGGIDSAHTLLYFARYGRDLLPGTPEGAGHKEEPRVRLVEEPVVTVPFASVEGLTGIDDLMAQVVRRSRQDLDTTSAGYGEWLDGTGSARPGSCGVLVLTHGELVEVPAGVDFTTDNAMTRALRLMLATRARA